MMIFLKPIKRGLRIYGYGWLLAIVGNVLGAVGFLLFEVSLWMRFVVPVITTFGLLISAHKADGQDLPYRRAWISVCVLTTIANVLITWFYWSHLFLVDTYMITPELSLISCLKADVVLALAVFVPILSYHLLRQWLQKMRQP